MLPPVILSFAADPPHIQPGGTSALSWVVKNAKGVSIEPAIGVRPPLGSVGVSPGQMRTFTLTARGEGATATATATVTVTDAPAVVILSAPPGGMLQRANQSGATDSYTLTNVGGAATSVTLTQTGSFFTQSPESFDLPAGSSQVVSIAAPIRPNTAPEAPPKGASLPR